MSRNRDKKTVGSLWKRSKKLAGFTCCLSAKDLVCLWCTSLPQPWVVTPFDFSLFFFRHMLVDRLSKGEEVGPLVDLYPTLRQNDIHSGRHAVEAVSSPPRILG